MAGIELGTYLRNDTARYHACLEACVECLVACEMCADACLQEENVRMLIRAFRCLPSLRGRVPPDGRQHGGVTGKSLAAVAARHLLGHC